MGLAMALDRSSTSMRVCTVSQAVCLDESWYGFERLTYVPIQTRIVLEHLLI
jgi:hypothetical protein